MPRKLANPLPIVGDKRHPACARCEKFGQPCPGYDKKRKFVDEGISLRKKFQRASPRGSGDEHDREDVRMSPPFHVEHLLTVTEQITDRDPHDIKIQNWLHGLTPAAVPERRSCRPTSPLNRALVHPGRTPIETHHPRAEHGMSTSVPVQPASPSIPDSDSVGNPGVNVVQSALPVEQQLDTLLEHNTFVEGPFDPEWFDLNPDIYYANQNNSCGFIPNAHIVDEVDRSDFRPDLETATGVPMSKSAPMSSAGTGLTRSNLWLPEDQMQTSAIIADEREHEMAYLIRHFTESLGPWMDLFDKDRHFSESVPLKALRDALVRNAIAAVAAKQLGRVKGPKPFYGSQCQQPSRTDVVKDMVDVDWFYKAANYYDKAIAFSRVYLEALSGTIAQSISVAKSDNLLVAVSIFSLYESLDNREMGWCRHLAGLKSVLTAVTADQQAIGQPMSSITVARKACFWNFARSDWSAAWINRRRTYLDPEDLNIWRSCGLQLQDDGALYADPIDLRIDTGQCRQTVQLVSHTLIWLLLCVTNYLARDSHRTLAQQLEMWDTLNTQLDAFHANLPESFQPCAQIRAPPPTREQLESDLGYCQFTEVFFSSSSSASSMQLYHFARLLLLLNRPREPERKGISRLQAYREVSSEATKHAREIVGVALGRPAPAVRVEMLLPLYIAGGCLEADEEKNVVLGIMCDIEKETGCSTEVTVRSLMDEWGWDREPLDSFA
ncbi:hypothetical protein LTR82_000790 [Friedmanniomyces endolithicus]|uniref:Zn(2)-C6 fungal-type domain-containing protein n=1 Tax=Friedmanniomyces endolithicus TaxID=329885 RepID=A0AAN6G2Q1_9PEZI|nr:hypothetical protein LTR82_000790 [Friedmanniomyces endolithicus]